MRRTSVVLLLSTALLIFGIRALGIFRSSELRIGHSYDIHRMHRVPNSAKPLVLGGIKISNDYFVEAHSDGDVILHAITDAILGAAGLPDIGELFSDKDERWRDATSDVFLSHVLGLVADRGFRMLSVDVTLILEKPRFSTYKLAVHENIRKLLGTEAVTVKARTHEGVDAVGENRAVSCHAVVLLERRSSSFGW